MKQLTDTEAEKSLQAQRLGVQPECATVSLE